MKTAEPRELRLEVVGFWSWLFVRDTDGSRGLTNVINWWLVVHAAIGLLLAGLASAAPIDIARGIALPGAAILVGLAFGWAGRSASLLQDRSFSKFLINNGPPAEGYVYSFQLAILTVLLLVAVSLGIIAGGLRVSFGSAYWDDLTNRFVLFLTASVAVRECWGVIYFVNKLTLQYYRLREQELESEGAETDGA